MTGFIFDNRANGAMAIILGLLLSFSPIAGVSLPEAQAQTRPPVTYTPPTRPSPPPNSRTRTDASGRTTFNRPPATLKAGNLKAIQKWATQADADCEVISETHNKSDTVIRDGKPLPGQVYEVACRNTRGYILLIKGSKLSEAIPCHISWEMRGQNPKSYACRILANRYSPDWISDRANAKLPDCSPVDALWISGFGKDTSIIEIHCANGLGGVLSFPSRRDTSDSQVTLISCLKLLDTEAKCQNTNATQAAKTFGAVFADKLPACTINNGRFIGANATVEFYEIGCADAPAFILATSGTGQFLDLLGCEKAANVGGCQFSPTRN